MVEAKQNNINRAVHRQSKKIGLDEALRQLIPYILYCNPVIASWTYVVHPHRTISQVFWNRKELAIEKLDAAIGKGDLLGSRLITPTMPGRQRDIQKRDNCVPVCHSGLRHV
jgi:hypothetical protein